MENTLSSVGAVEKHSQNTEFCITGQHYRKGNNYCSSLGVMYLSDFNGVSVFYWFFCWVCSYFTQFMFTPWSQRPFPLAPCPGTSCLQQPGLSGSPWHWCDPSLQPVKAYCQRASSNQWQPGILLCWVLLSAAGSPDKLFRLLLQAAQALTPAPGAVLHALSSNVGVSWEVALIKASFSRHQSALFMSPMQTVRGSPA